MDAHSGAVLTEQNADERVEPASLAKIMTAYLVFKEIKAGKLSLGEEVLVSEPTCRTGWPVQITTGLCKAHVPLTGHLCLPGRTTVWLQPV